MYIPVNKEYINFLFADYQVILAGDHQYDNEYVIRKLIVVYEENYMKINFQKTKRKYTMGVGGA